MKEIDINHGGGKLQSGIIYPEIFPIDSHDTVLNIGCGGGVQAVTYRGNFKKMVGVDINADRLEAAKKLMEYYEINNFFSINANVEEIPLDEQFDKIIAIDIIEHVVNPKNLVNEARRLLKTDGSMLVTFPAMHDKYENFIKFVGRRIFRRKPKAPAKDGWDPDKHQYDYSVSEWLKIMDEGGFNLTRSRASTLFPPLHYLGLPKFWFSNKLIHRIDGFLCGLPVIKNYGQALVGVFQKKQTT